MRGSVTPYEVEMSRFRVPFSLSCVMLPTSECCPDHMIGLRKPCCITLMKTKTLFMAFAFAVLAPATPASAQSRQIEPLRIERTVEPIFPSALVRTHPKGIARLVLNVSSQGALEDALVVGYNARGFADEALWVVKRWRYEPARLGGEPIASSWEVVITFEHSGAMVSLFDVDGINQVLNGAYVGDEVYRPRLLHELDRPPVATKTAQPAYTEEMQRRGLKGAVTVNFYIDEEGNVRMPSLQEQDHNILGVNAVAALRQWKFEPPTVGGKPALVKARQVFHFNPPATPLPAIGR
jgi:TonB family protein